MDLKMDILFSLEAPLIEQRNQGSFSSVWKNLPLFVGFDNGLAEIISKPTAFSESNDKKS